MDVPKNIAAKMSMVKYSPDKTGDKSFHPLMNYLAKR